MSDLKEKKIYIPPGAKKNVLHYTTDNVQKLRAISCFNLPDDYLLDKERIKNHFKQFGRITRCTVNPVNKVVIIHFANHDMAEAAKTNGCNNLPDGVRIMFTKTSKTRPAEETKNIPSTIIHINKPENKSPIKTSSNPFAVKSQTNPFSQSTSNPFSLKPTSNPFSAKTKTTFTADPEVNEELQSMGGDDYSVNTRKPTSVLQQSRLGAKPTKGLFTAKFKKPAEFEEAQPQSTIFSKTSLESSKPTLFKTPEYEEQPQSSSSVFTKRAIVESNKQNILMKKETDPATLRPLPNADKLKKSVVSTSISRSELMAKSAPLLEAIKQPAFTVSERFNVLEARDKILRLGQTKNTNLAAAKRTQGTCQDMCPEKERYLREERRQVSAFEQNQSGEGICHKLAVKQYSRSSADQELPLAHELRPSPILRKTMNYLLSHIVPLIDRPGENIGDWYFFLWDRTRAIRKDITQQDLCDLDAVTLVEQCARFHVACCSRLASEDVTVMDPKINTENLTKCLQTLKHMYHDMSLKGLECPNEAEFRSYIALLNLNSGDAMREVQELKPEIRETPAVKYAVQAYLSLTQKNYVRFFRVVRSIGYLGAAILMRYFTQSRTAAIEIMCKSLCPSFKVPIPYSLSEMTRLLGFENSEEAANFCDKFGLDTNLNNDTVCLSRLNLMHPETVISQKRSFSLVENQLKCTLAEVIAGCPMNEINAEPAEPISSFHPTTNLLTQKAKDEAFSKSPAKTATSAAVAATKSFGTDTPMGQTVFSQPFFNQVRPTSSFVGGFNYTPTNTPSPSNNTFVIQTKANAKCQEIIDQVVTDMVKSIAMEMERNHKLDLYCFNLLNNILYNTTNEYISEMCYEEYQRECNEIIERKKALEIERLKLQQRNEFIDQFSILTLNSLLETATADIIEEETIESIKKEVSILRTAGAIQKQILADVIDSSLQPIAVREILHAQKKRAAEVEAIAEKFRLNRARKVLLRWRDKALRAKKLWERVCDFPAGPLISLDVEEQADELNCSLTPYLVEKFDLDINYKCKNVETQSFPLVNMQNIASSIHRNIITTIPAIITGEDVTATPPTWNIVISLPAQYNNLKQWLYECISPLNDLQKDIFTYQMQRVLLRFSIIIGHEIPKYKPHAIAIIVSPECEKENADRLLKLFEFNRKKNLKYEACPVALLMLNGSGIGVSTEICDALQLLGEKDLLYHVRTFNLPDDPESHDEIENALKWLAHKTTEPLEMYISLSLTKILKNLLCINIWNNIIRSTLSSNKARIALQEYLNNPNFCLKLSNEQIEELSCVLEFSTIKLDDYTIKYLQDSNKDSAQFYTSNSYKLQILKVIRSLKFSSLNIPAELDEKWTQLFEVIHQFCNTFIKDKNSLQVTYHWIFQQINTYKLNGITDPNQLPWASLIEYILSEVIICDKNLNKSNILIDRLELFRLLTTSDWCTLQMKSTIESLCSSSKASHKLTNDDINNMNQRRKRKLDCFTDKLDALLNDLENCKSKFQTLDDTLNSEL